MVLSHREQAAEELTATGGRCTVPRVNARAALAALLLSCASASGKGGSPEPAVAAAAGSNDAGAAEDAPCASAADCALTRAEAGACCPMLCAPRAVTRERAAQLAAKVASCGESRCPQPLCRAPAHALVAACEGGRCVARAVAGD